MPTKWLQERADGSKNGHGIGFEGPGVEATESVHKGSPTGTVPESHQNFHRSPLCGEEPREKKIIRGHLPRVTYYKVY